VLITFKYRLYPSKTQQQLLNQTLETCRRWYNACLAERRDAWQNEQRSVSKYEQLAKIKDLRKTNPFAGQVHSHLLQVVVQDLDKAFNAFFRRLAVGETPGYPRFKGPHRFASFGLKEYSNGFKVDGRRLRLFGIGRVAMRWHRPFEGQIRTLRIVRTAGQWYACFTCEVEQPEPLPATGKEVGLDVGLKSLLTTSEGETVENPRWYRQAQKRLQVLQRRVSRRQPSSSNRHTAVRALQRQHAYLANSRQDFLNKLAYRLIIQYDRIAVEELQIANMARNHTLAKSILDAGWGYFKMHLAHKAAEAGRVVYGVDPAYTSKSCSRCGRVFASLTLQDRWVQCDCGLSLDRDHNAALNILKRAGHARWGET
jgi:putative transposase